MKFLIFICFAFFACEKPLENELFNRLGVPLFSDYSKFSIKTINYSSTAEQKRINVSQENSRMVVQLLPLTGAHTIHTVEFAFKDPILLKDIKSLKLDFEYSHSTSNASYTIRKEHFDEIYPRVFFKLNRPGPERDWEIVANLDDLSKYTDEKEEYYIKIDLRLPSGNPRDKEFIYNETTFYISNLNLLATY